MTVWEGKIVDKPVEKYFLNWEEAVSSALTEVGGKGQNLSRLHRYGFPVPIGGVLTSRAYWDFLQYNGLSDSIRAAASIKAEAVLEPANEKILAEIRRKIIDGQVPEIIIQELAEKLADMELFDKPVAVRSSATAEDSAAASFAGIHESFLNVLGLPHIIKAIKRCYASLWTTRAVAYRRKMGFGDEKVAASVVIMELVPSVAAGVAFSCDPLTGRRDLLTMSANFGLGESVVSGAVKPDEYLLDITMELPEIIKKKTGSKKQYTRVRSGGGTELVVSSGEFTADEQVLNDHQIIELGLLTLRVYEALGSGIVHQDIEWAYDGKKFFVLQARPATNLPEPTFPEIAGQPLIWSNANIKDAFPFVQTPLTWSFLRGYLPRMLSAHLRAAGYPVPEGINWVRLYKGRSYFNLSAFQWGWYDAIGSLPGRTNAFLGGHQPDIEVPSGNPLGGQEGIKRLWRQLKLIINILRTRLSAKKIFKDIWENAESRVRLNFHTMTEDELVSLSSKIRLKSYEYAPTFMILNSSYVLPLDMLVNTLDNDFPDRGYALTNSLLAGSSEITSAEHGYRLMELAQSARKDDAAYKYFVSEHFTPTLFREKIPANTQFRKEFEEFLRKFGHRAVYECELLNPRWREDPTYLLENIRAAVLSPGNTDYRKVQAVKRRVAEEEIAAKLKWSLQRIKISMLVRQAGKGAQMREMAKSILVKLVEPSRLICQEIGRRLVERGILNEQVDVYYCTWPELASILKRYWDGTGLKILVGERKKTKEELSDLEPPDVIIGEAPQPKTRSPEATGQVLTGLGVAAGRATGKARLINHPRENSRLQTGEVLVAPSTDPGWTPLFLRASALVMEVGGYLSHGAIVAREYGIPTVVNVPGVMKIVHDGEILTVDGDSGKIFRE